MDKNQPARRKETFDLTTETGIKTALDALEAYSRWGWMTPGFLPLWLFKKGYDSIAQRELDTLEAQKTVAIDLIKAGSEQQHLKAMKIVMDQTVGLDLGSEVEGIPIKAKIGKSSHMIVEAKYKR